MKINEYSRQCHIFTNGKGTHIQQKNQPAKKFSIKSENAPYPGSFLSAMDTLTVVLVGALLLSLPVLLTMQKAATKHQRPIIKDSPEILEPITASFVGQLPGWMNGTLFRIGKFPL